MERVDNLQYLQHLVEPFGPRRPIKALIEDVNRAYHALEAREYDGRHPEIVAQLPEIWRAMLAQVEQHLGTRPCRVLDFGCGTGFEASQMLDGLPPARVAQLCCYDLSPEMVAVCRAKIAPRASTAVFTDDLAAVAAHGPYDLLITNSLVHHLPSPETTLRDLERHLAPDALWLAGHEPSARFYRNPACVAAIREYRARRYFDLGRYRARLRSVLSRGRPLNVRVAEEARRRGLFERCPSPGSIGRLVDAWVAHDVQEAESGRGFDVDTLAAHLGPGWSVVWFRSYSFMGYYYEGRLPRRWQRRARALAAQWPDDGANFSTVWKRGAPAAN